MYYLEMAKFMVLFQRNKLTKFIQTTKFVRKYKTKCTRHSYFYLHATNPNAAKKTLISGAQIWNSLQPKW